MEALFRSPSAVRRSPEADAWFGRGDPARAVARTGFEAPRGRVAAAFADVRARLEAGAP